MKSAPLQVPLQSLETEFPAEAYPYSLAHLAVARLARSGGPAALKAFCRAGGVRTAWRDAFRRSFGFDVATFYAQFEAYRRAF